MASKDANKTRRGVQVITDLSQQRIKAREAGETPKCGSPLVGQAGKENPDRCKRSAGLGTDHPGYGACSKHAGNMKPAKVTAAREAVVVEVNQYKRFYGVKAEISFEEGLLEEFQRSVGIVRWIESKLGNWESPVHANDKQPIWDDQTGMPALLEAHWGANSVTIADTEHAAWLRQYNLERVHLAKVAKMGIDAGVAKGVLAVYARQADLMNQIIRETMKRLGIAGDDRVAHVLPTVIREITAKAS